MRKFIILRASLVPYSYSNARTAYDEGIILPMYSDGVIHCSLLTGLSLLRPMYYEFPESPEAYTFDKQVSRPCMNYYASMKMNN